MTIGFRRLVQPVQRQSGSRSVCTMGCVSGSGTAGAGLMLNGQMPISRADLICAYKPCLAYSSGPFRPGVVSFSALNSVLFSFFTTPPTIGWATYNHPQPQAVLIIRYGPVDGFTAILQKWKALFILWILRLVKLFIARNAVDHFAVLYRVERRSKRHES